MEYYVPFCEPHFKKDVEKLESSEESNKNDKWLNVSEQVGQEAMGLMCSKGDCRLDIRKTFLTIRIVELQRFLKTRWKNTCQGQSVITWS